jgi:L-alanine-DL-glutamate epimerase-like enolase superfamily enzyme
MSVVPTVIKQVHVQPLNIPMVESFGIAGGAQSLAANVLLTVELNDGTLGYGEAAPLPPFNGETQKMAVAALEHIAFGLRGADVRRWRSVCQGLRQFSGGVHSAQCAAETAIMDAFTRHARMPLWSFFGGSVTELETDMTVAIPPTLDAAESAAHAGQAARSITERGIRVIKTKVGGGGVGLDIARVRAIHEQAPDSPLLLDGNAGFTADGALELVERLRHLDIVPVLFEQPVHVDDLGGLRRVREESGVRVAADESACTLARVREMIAMGATDVVNIKLMKTGIVEALDIAALCRASGTGLMIGGMLESILAASASACFAAGLGGFEFVDLDTPLFMAENPFQGGFHLQGALIDVTSITQGHGVTPLVESSGE